MNRFLHDFESAGKQVFNRDIIQILIVGAPHTHDHGQFLAKFARQSPACPALFRYSREISRPSLSGVVIADWSNPLSVIW